MSSDKGRWPNLLGNIQNLDSTKRLVILRLFLATSLLAAAVACAVASLLTLQSGEANRFNSEYRAVVEGSVKIVASSFSRLNTGIQELASTYSYNFPRVEQWPNVGWHGFTPTARLLGRSSAVDGMAFLPLVRPEQLADYEAYIKQYYATDPFFEPEAYNAPFMPEGLVWSVNYSSVPPMPYHDITGETAYSPHQILTPSAQYTFSSLVGPGLSNFNVHSLPSYGLAMDSTIDCAARNNYSYAVTSCGALSDVIALPFPELGGPEVATEDMVAMFVHPIFPSQNNSELVGFAVGAVSWRALLSDVFPSYLRSFDIVIETETATFTFSTEKGEANFKGHGDCHDRNFDNDARSMDLLSNSGAISSSPKYVITIYPTKRFATEFFTDRPMWAAVALSLVFVYCAALFFAYDYLVQRQSGRHEAVLDTKRRFVRFISHEIRTPLNTVRLGMKLLEVELAKLLAAVLAVPGDGLLDQVRRNLASWQSLADDIILNSEIAVEVLNDLLNYDKIEMGTLRLDFTLVNACALLRKVIAVMQVQAQQKNIKLELAEGTAQLIAANRTMIVGDTMRIEQVVRSLIANALRFTPSDGKVTISVKTTSSTKLPLPAKAVNVATLDSHLLSHGTLTVAVKDSGAGLSDTEIAEINAEGVQFNANELLSGQGSGLGLFISKGIVVQHGGRLLVASEGLGCGTTFSAILPFCDDITPSARRSAVKDAPSETTLRASICASLPPEPQRMLVVDDSPFNRKMLIRLLSTKSHTCEQAEDGEVAVRKYLEMVDRGEPPDAILMDFEMPVMNGPSATARLRELGCACLIVGVTGNVLPHDVAFFLEHGANAVLPKPLILEDFEQLLYGPRSPILPTALSGHPLLRVSVKDTIGAHAETAKISPIENV